ncbi:hypothetical protein ACSYG7_12850 [Bacillus velezensis]|uniref:hypothetical protein n=1 Tax=Bacillus TaxID=1386 RepID=UPI00039679FC|nr:MULTISPECIES: hypothetical protein [Bacillus amyloliquefaciens group]ERH56135.1 hypothetical protein O205_06545 [Bacillus amyloliquefaciens EGD-AQ14]MCY9464107.1 hypothetical protein [Bacillus velezensis]NRF36981.1 hypothetical protein [Bacillus velezensis]QAR57581.1 hypothetical protein EBA29_02557 [Bacillus velezensis]TKZ16396.1 hypothetical protein FAZ22_15015 [Bacillus velezensis]
MLMLILSLNLLLLIVCFWSYSSIENKMSESLFFDPGSIQLLRVIFIPVVFFIFNLIITLIFLTDYWYVSFAFLVIPIFYGVRSYIHKRSLNALYAELEEVLPKLIMKKLKDKNIFVEKKDVRFTVYSRRKVNYVNVIVKLNKRHGQITHEMLKIKEDLSENKPEFEFNLLFEKKSDLSFYPLTY